LSRARINAGLPAQWLLYVKVASLEDSMSAVRTTAAPCWWAQGYRDGTIA